MNPAQVTPAGDSDQEAGEVHDPSASRADLLAAGRRAEDDGRFDDAIDLLTRAYRLEPDTTLAGRLVELRNRAFDAAAAAPGAGTWPPEGYPDPFPELARPPEIAPSEISAATVGGAILHHGCVLVRGLLPRGEAEAMRADAIRALAARDAYADGARDPEVVDWYHPFSPAPERGDPAVERVWVQQVGGMLVADSPRIMLQLFDALEATGLTNAIADYLGEQPAVSYNKCVLRKLRESAPTWHQDGAFMGTELRTVDVWLALSDCGEGAPAPGLDILPARIDEMLETETHGAIFPNSIGHGLVEQVAGEAGLLTPRFEPGDAILFDDRFVHRSSVREGHTEERYALETWFFAPSRFPSSYIPILT